MAQAMQENYRDSKISEQKKKRTEKYLRDSQKVCEQLDHSQVCLIGLFNDGITLSILLVMGAGAT